MKHSILALIAATLFSALSFADNAEYIHVIKLDKSDYVKALSLIGRIQFTDNQLTVVDNTADANVLFSCNINDAKTIVFNNDAQPTILAQIAQDSPITVKAYPNPASEYLTISGLDEGQTIRLFDLQGKTVMQTTNTTLSLSGLPAGVYLLQAGQQVVKVVKNK